MRHYWFDRILAMEPGASATAVKGVALSEDFFGDHFPGNPIYPGIYVIEGLAQVAGLLLHESTGREKVSVLASVDRARFLAYARPGDALRLEVAIEALSGETARVAGEARVGERRIAAARLTLRLWPLAEVVAEEYLPFWRGTYARWRGEYLGEDR